MLNVGLSLVPDLMNLTNLYCTLQGINLEPSVYLSKLMLGAIDREYDEMVSLFLSLSFFH